MTGSFTVDPFPDDKPYTIAFHHVEGVKASPDDRALARGIGEDLDLVNRLLSSMPHSSGKALRERDYVDSPEFQRSFQSFLAAARVGVEHPNADIESGRSSHESAKKNFVATFGRRLRKVYISRLTKVCFAGCVVAAAALLLFFLRERVKTLVDISDAFPYVRATALAFLGNALAIWVTAVLYVQRLNWEKLDYLDSENVSPVIRVGTVFAITIILMMLLDQGVLILGLGNVMLNNFQNSIGIPVLIGLLCGMSELRVTEIIRGIFERVVERPQNPT